MALKEYIGLSRLTQAFSLLKSKIDTKAELAESMTTEEFDEAENLPDGLYPIEEEDLVPITADMVKYDSGHTVEDKIDELNSDIAELFSSEFGTSVTVGSTDYTTEHDGYVRANVSNNAEGQIYVNGIRLIDFKNTSGTGNQLSIYVKKGTVLRNASVSGVTAEFIPYIVN